MQSFFRKTNYFLLIALIIVLVSLSPLPAFPSAHAGYVPSAPDSNYMDAYPSYKIAAILVTFSDKPAKPNISGTKNPWTKSYVDGVLFSNNDSMAAFFAETSNGAISVTGEVFDNNGLWYTINRPATIRGTCNWRSYFDETLAAVDVDIDYTQYNTIVVLSPQKTCGAEGLAGSVDVPEAGYKMYGAIDINGNMGSNPHHELGHLLQLGHANSWQCDAPGVMYGTNCRNIEYADRYNIMGATGSRTLLLTGQQLENYGWIPASDVTTATVDGDYTIQAFELHGNLPRVLKIPLGRDANGNINSWYYLEYRQLIGFDKVSNINRFLKPTAQELGVPNGVLVHAGNSQGDNFSSTLLDMTPGSLPGGKDIFDPALPLGYSYSDSVAGVSFGVLARNATAMAIRVKFSAESLCQPKAPTVSIKTIKGSGKPGQELRYDLTVKNNSTLCGKQSLELRTLKAPAGWKVTIDKQKKKTVSVVSRQTQKFVVRIVPPKKSKYQKYSLSLEARLAKKPSYKKTTLLQPRLK
ncbi:hypothetical protein C4546_02490 [Candidatus Parcubacteria bacterium]|jgi:hypothetical protein|nr:MAG: hypothetical protein C4546_02490 [Candidatus Parcubacteria bacterium]